MLKILSILALAFSLGGCAVYPVQPVSYAPAYVAPVYVSPAPVVSFSWGYRSGWRH
jgi:hypothetical protein